MENALCTTRSALMVAVTASLAGEQVGSGVIFYYYTRGKYRVSDPVLWTLDGSAELPSGAYDLQLGVEQRLVVVPKTEVH